MAEYFACPRCGGATTSDARGRPCPACSAGDATVTHGRVPIGGGLSFSLGPAPWGSEPLLSVALPQLPHVQQVALGTEADQGAGTPAAEAASREDCSPRFQLLGEIARGGMGASSRAGTSTSAATWPSRCSWIATATARSWSAGSSRRRRSAASCSIPGSCPSTSSGSCRTAGRSSA